MSISVNQPIKIENKEVLKVEISIEVIKPEDEEIVLKFAKEIYYIIFNRYQKSSHPVEKCEHSPNKQLMEFFGYVKQRFDVFDLTR